MSGMQPPGQVLAHLAEAAAGLAASAGGLTGEPAGC
jgi:hypothetical protein